MARNNRDVYVIMIGEDDVYDLMDDMQERAKNLKPVFNWAKRKLELANAENFAQAGLPSGGWKPLSPRYGAWKSRNFPGAPILFRSGKLFRSVTSFAAADTTINDTSASFSTSVEFAKFHQYGTSRMPARKVIFEPPRFARELGEEVAQYVVGGEKGIGALGGGS